MIQGYINNTLYRYASKWVVLVIDLLTVGVAFVLSYFILFNLTLNFKKEELLIQIPLILIIYLFAFLTTSSFKGVIRHTGIRDVYNIFNSVCLSSILVIFLILINRKMAMVAGFTIPLTIIIIHSLISFLLLTSSRFVFKNAYKSIIRNIKTEKNILIYGAGESGILTSKAISNNLNGNSKVIGYIDDDKQKTGKQINGISIYSNDALSESFISKKDVSEVIFSMQNIEANRLIMLVESLVDLPVLVKIVPPFEDWMNGELKVSQIKQIQIEDLLNRAPIVIKNSKIKEKLNGKVVLVTGGAGSIGGELVRQICKNGYESIIVIDQAESNLYDLQQELNQENFNNIIYIVGDIRDKNRMTTIYEEFNPNIVFHAAAYKHVPLMEYNSYEAIKINIAGTKVIADLSNQYGVERFVFVSTDKAVNPTNVMGATKRIAEIYIGCLDKKSKTKFIITRFGNVIGSNGSVIPLFKKQIAQGGPLTLTHKDVTRYFMTIPEASQLVLEAGAMGNGGEIFIFDMGKSVKIFDLAKNMIKLSGLNYPKDIDIKITGLRPGEKLYEELLANGENMKPTYHSKIMISNTRHIDSEDTIGMIDQLCISNMFFDIDTIRMMKKIVPEFISKNSEFSKIDEKIIMNRTM